MITTSVSVYEWDTVQQKGNHRDTLRLTREEALLAARIRDALRIPIACYGEARLLRVGERTMLITVQGGL